MKKFFALILLLLLGTTILSSCRKAEPEETPPDAEILPTHYSIEAALDPTESRLAVKTDIEYSLPADDLTAIKLRLYANIYREGNRIVAEEDYDAVYPKGVPSYGGVEIKEISQDGVPLPYEIGLQGTLLTLRLTEKMRKGTRITLHVEEEITLANCKHRLSYYEGYYHLSRFYPEMCPYRDGSFVAHPYTTCGDPFLSDCADFSLQLTLPENYIAAASSKENHRENQGSIKRYEYTLESARDFAVIASPLFKRREGSVREIPICYYYGTDRSSGETLTHIEKSLDLYIDIFGNYPYPSYTVVSAPFFEAGMEHSGLGLIANDLSSTLLKKTITHETAHQWWYGKVGSDEYLHPWMDEGLTEYAVAYFYKSQVSDASYRALINRAESSFSTRLSVKGQEGARFDKKLSEMEDGYYERVYCGGLLLFHSLAQLVGYDRFHAALRAYGDAMQGSVAEPEDLIRVLSESLDHDYTTYFDLWLTASLPIL